MAYVSMVIQENSFHTKLETLFMYIAYADRLPLYEPLAIL